MILTVANLPADYAALQALLMGFTPPLELVAIRPKTPNTISIDSVAPLPGVQGRQETFAYISEVNSDVDCEVQVTPIQGPGDAWVSQFVDPNPPTGPVTSLSLVCLSADGTKTVNVTATAGS